MRHFGFAVLITLGCLLASGCQTTAGYQNRMDHWQGRNINDLIEKWGYPEKTIKAPNNNSVYVYKYDHKMVIGGYWRSGKERIEYRDGEKIVHEGRDKYVPEQTFHHPCTTWVEFNKQNIITNISFKGNGCRA